MNEIADRIRAPHWIIALAAAVPAWTTAGCLGPDDAAVDEASLATAPLVQDSAQVAAKGGRNGPVGTVYVASNKLAGNEILSFSRFADGTLKPGPRVATGGNGSGIGQIIPNDPLGSQGSLIADPQRQLLFAVNASSNDVSVFDIGRGGLARTDRRPSRGLFPVSLTFKNDTLYVANAISNSITGFAVDPRGHLSELQTCALPALPGLEGPLPATPTQSAQPAFPQTVGQIGFSPDGTKLIVVSKEGPLLATFPFGPTLSNGRIHVYDVDGHGRLSNCGRPTTTVLPLNRDGKGRTPFSFTWSAEGQLLVTEVFGVGTSPTAPGSAVSSYLLRRDGSLAPISQSIGNGQVAVCWIVRSGRFVYTANFLSDDVSSYENKSGLKLVKGQAATLAAGSTPSDLAVTGDERFIYQLASGASAILPFAVSGAAGALTALPPASDGQNWTGYAGLATVDLP